MDIIYLLPSLIQFLTLGLEVGNSASESQCTVCKMKYPIERENVFMQTGEKDYSSTVQLQSLKASWEMKAVEWLENVQASTLNFWHCADADMLAARKSIFLCALMFWLWHTGEAGQKGLNWCHISQIKIGTVLQYSGPHTKEQFNNPTWHWAAKMFKHTVYLNRRKKVLSSRTLSTIHCNSLSDYAERMLMCHLLYPTGEFAMLLYPTGEASLGGKE